MVLIANSNGTISSITPSVVTQGSNLVQSVYLICPVSNFTAVDVMFILPDISHTIINGGVMTPGTPSAIDGALLNSFTYLLRTSATNYPGQVQMVFKCYNTTGEILATYTSSFMVVKSTKPILPEIPDTEVYEQLLEAFAYVTGKLETGEFEAKGINVYDENFSYQQGAMTYLKTDDVVDFYISLVENNLGNALTDSESWYKVTDYYKKTEADAKFLQKDFKVLAERTYLQLVDFVALHSDNVTYKTSLDTLRAYLTQGLVGLTFQIVEELPATGIGNVIYMVPFITAKESYSSLEDFPAAGEANKRYIAEDTELQYLWKDEAYTEYDEGYIEYIWIEEKERYENIGLSKIQLSEYAKISWVNETFIAKSDIVDNLTTDDATKVASAKQVKILQDNKADKVPTATENNFVSFDSVGNIKDSTKKASDFANLAGGNTFSGIQLLTGTELNLLKLQNTDPASYSRIQYVGTGKTFNAGVGNASSNIVDLRDKWYIYDATGAKVLFTIDSDGNIENLSNINLPTGKTYKINDVDILSIIYPIGAIYSSISSTSPASLFGGTWEQLEDRFLLGAGSSYTAGETGGEATHSHTLGDNGYAKISFGWENENRLIMSAKTVDDYVTNTYNPASGWPDPNQTIYRGSNYFATTLGGTTNAKTTLPPYLVVYMWKRVA